MVLHPYHKELSALHVGCEAPRAYYIPYQSDGAARTMDREQSAYFQNLCGEWDFRFYDTFEDLPEDFPAEPLDRNALRTFLSAAAKKRFMADFTGGVARLLFSRSGFLLLALHG